MKKLIAYITVLSALCAGLVSCAGEEGAGGPQQGSDTVEAGFTFTLPDAGLLASRAWDAGEEGLLQSVWVMVFDNNGAFISRHVGTKTDVAKYKFTLPVTDDVFTGAERNRILHFVCNADWTGFDDAANVARNELDMIPQMTTGDGRIGYWTRVELADGITQTSVSALSTVMLMRNTAKITVVNKTEESTTVPYLTDVEYALGGYHANGTIALYDRFAQAFVTDNTDAGNPTAICDMRSDAVVRADEGALMTAHVGNVSDASGESSFMYEIANAQIEQPSYIIIKAKYNSMVGSSPVVDEVTYYKINIVDDNAESLLDIQRNKHYVINITEALEKGVETFNEAVTSEFAMNNLGTAVGQQYTSISNGVAVLNVEHTSRTFVRTMEDFQIRYTYMPDAASGSTMNNLVTWELDAATAAQVVHNSTITSQPGVDATGYTVDYLTGKTAAALPVGNTVYETTLTVTGKDAGGQNFLQRSIILRLRNPFQFDNVSVPSSIAKGTGKTVTIAFTIPETIGAALFPMPIYITAPTLSPDLTENILSQDQNSMGELRYRYMAQGPGRVTITMQTVTQERVANIRLSGEYFSDFSVTDIPRN